MYEFSAALATNASIAAEGVAAIDRTLTGLVTPEWILRGPDGRYFGRMIVRNCAFEVETVATISNAVRYKTQADAERGRQGWSVLLTGFTPEMI